MIDRYILSKEPKIEEQQKRFVLELIDADIMIKNKFMFYFNGIAIIVTIVLFVIIPFQGSGGLVGSIVGRLIGMKPINTFYAIIIGSVSGTILIAYFADAILAVFIKNILIGLLIIIIILVIRFMIFVYKRSKNSR